MMQFALSASSHFWVSLDNSRAIYCNRPKARICCVGLVLKGIEHLQMHSAFQNSARLPASIF
jgi:hypothetical protein